jgi:hypothetical protein
MIEYLYTKDYMNDLPDYKDKGTEAFTAGPNLEAIIEGGDDRASLDDHAQVCEVADYYHIPGLAELANMKITHRGGLSSEREEIPGYECLSTKEIVSQLPLAVDVSRRIPHPAAIHTILVNLIETCLGPLLNSRGFWQIDDLSEYAVELLRPCGRVINRLNYTIRANQKREDDLRDRYNQVMAEKRELIATITVLQDSPSDCVAYNCKSINYLTISDSRIHVHCSCGKQIVSSEVLEALEE